MFKQRVGDIVFGKVTETVGATGLIVSFRGQLLRLENQSTQRFSDGQTVQLRIIQVQPLRFQLIAPGHRRFDRHV